MRKVWLFLIVALFLVSLSALVTATAYTMETTSNSSGPPYTSSSTSTNRVGGKIYVKQNCSLITIQKHSNHNPADGGKMSIRCENTSITNTTAEFVGDNATFSIPIPLVAGYTYRIYDNDRPAGETLYYTANWYPPVQDRTYTKFFTGCYGTTCDADSNTGYGSLYKIYLSYETPEEYPTWSNNITNATTPIYLGTPVQSWVYLQDETEVSHFICSWNGTAGTWANGTTNTAGASAYNSSCIGTIPKTPGDKTIGYMEFFNDSANQWNKTDIFIYDVTDNYPQYGGFDDNVTEPTSGGVFRFYSYFTDDGNLSHHYFTIYNSTKMYFNKTIENDWGCTTALTDCYNICYGPGGNSACHTTITDPGTYHWKICANDTNNQWNCTPYTKNFTITGTNPQYYDYGTNVTEIVLGRPAYLYSNWTTAGGTLTKYKLNEKLPNGSWYNTSWMNFDCADYTDCIINVTSLGTMEPVGMHYFTFTANNSQYGTNETPMYGINVKVDETLWLYEDDPLFFGSDLFQETTQGNFSYLPIETASRGITALTIPPVMKDITGDGLDEVFFLDGNHLEIYTGIDLTIVNTTTLVGENFHRFILVPNWTANYSVLALSEDRGNVMFNNLEITNDGSSFALTTTNITDWFTGYRGGELLMGCGNQTCVIAYTQINYSIWDGVTPNATTGLFAFSFHNDMVSHSTPLLLQNNTANGGICFSRYKNMEVIDYDGDGDTEAIFTIMSINNPANDELVSVWYLDSTDAGLELEHRMNITMGNPVRFGGGDGTIKCYDDGINHSYTGANRFFTNILVFNSGVNATSLETHIGVSKDDFDTSPGDYDWKIMVIDNAWNVQSVDPLFDNGIMSNLVKAGDNSFCGWGFRPSPNDKMLCGSNSSDLTTHQYDVNDFDLTYNYDWSDTLYSTNLIFNVSDWVIRNAVYYYDSGDLEALTSWSYSGATPIPIVSESGVDLIITTATTMYYYDDGYVEQPAQIDWWKVNPCIYDINGYEVYWENETRVLVWVNVSDGDPFNKDNVSLRYILYNGTANEQISAWTDGGASSVQFIINTSVNYTTQNITLYDTFIIQVNDTGNKTIVNASFKYQVNTSNIIATVEYGDCAFEMGGYIYNGTAQEGELVNNTWIQGIKDAGEMAGFQGEAGVKVFWILLMAFIGFILWVKVGATDATLATALIIGVELMLLFVGYYFNLIPGLILFIVFLVGLVVGIFALKNKIMSE